MVALGGVEHELAQQFAGGGIDDPDVEVLDKDQDVGSGVGSADADGVELALVFVASGYFFWVLVRVAGRWAGNRAGVRW